MNYINHSECKKIVKNTNYAELQKKLNHVRVHIQNARSELYDVDDLIKISSLEKAEKMFRKIEALVQSMLMECEEHMPDSPSHFSLKMRHPAR